MSIMGKPKQHLELASAYFVPTQQGTYYLKQLRVEGIKVRALTNFLLQTMLRSYMPFIANTV